MMKSMLYVVFAFFSDGEKCIKYDKGVEKMVKSSLRSYILNTKITITNEEIVNYLWGPTNEQKVLDKTLVF